MKKYFNNLNQIASFFVANINSKITIAFSILFFLMGANTCFAGDYHNQNSRRPLISQTPATGVTLACAQCHMMHGTQGALFSLEYFGNLVTHPKLLRNPSVVELCKFCHEDDPFSLGAPIIFDPENFTRIAPVYNASAGAFSPGSIFNFSDCSKYPPAFDPFDPANLNDGDKRHDIGCDVFNIPPPGFVAGVSNPLFDSLNIKDVGFWNGTVLPSHGSNDRILSCEFCHDQHGNTNYRNVRPTPYDANDRVPGGVGADGTPKAIVTYDNGAVGQSINQLVIDGDANGSPPANQFRTGNIDWRTNTNQIAGFCGKCHINFFGVGGDKNLGGNLNEKGDSIALGGDEWKRHPVGGMKLSDAITNGHADPQDLTGFRAIMPGFPGPSPNPDAEPFCFTCHRVHGSTNYSNLIYGAATSVGGAGAMIRDTCNQCHNQ